ncbi:MAG: 3-deoxy-manno-octulosonate cytidylyltransferase [Alphaproteobacteria bacterium]|jgi:3-deoxy-manno-octulosonate cytidylyltransferase (CMP-KDO synthetase)|nr:3-deoxy-manno-octulosonate cytidylyltransferase [Alphaproteobacteria bacterium]MDP6515919.1 3-deoxy-manno-octulosonate cytidylyltransferase [Alphaproteobacteria bacterium]
MPASLSAVVLIPARLASTRLPDKPLAPIEGEEMIVHVWRRAVESEVGPVVVACADRSIAKVIEAAGGRAVMTRPDHPSGSDRIHEALEEADPNRRADVVINLQGDLPAIDPAAIRAVLDPLGERQVDIATLASEIIDLRECENPDVVKAVVGFERGSLIGRALYFTRGPAPWGEGPLFHHIGIYGYRRAALERFVGLPPSPLEKRERLEQLRALDAGMRIDVALVDSIPLGVDTPGDLERARRIMAARRGRESR